MHILTNEQVKYCNLILDEFGKIIHLPGISYQNKLFIKSKFFSLEQEQEALSYGKKEFIANKGNIDYILLQDNIGYTVWAENSSAKILSINEQKLDIVKTINLEELVAQMRSIGGIIIKDRRYKLKTYPKCFVGSEAVTWMKGNLNLSVQQAVELGQRLIDENWIHHVVDEHDFQNEFFFYRFYWDED